MTAAVLARRFTDDRRRLLIGTGIGAFAMTALQAALYPSVRDTFGELSNELPDAWLAIIGTDDFTSVEGYLQAESFGTYGPLLVSLVAVSFGSGVIAAGDRLGMLQLIATTPTTRRRIALSAALATAIAVVSAAMAIWLALALSVAFGVLDIGLGPITEATVGLALFGLAAAAVAFAIGTGTGRRGLALGLTSGFLVWSFFAHNVLPLVEALRPLRRVSLWYPYAESVALSGDSNPWHLLTLILIAVAGVGIGVVGFERRDIA